MMLRDMSRGRVLVLILAAATFVIAVGNAKTSSSGMLFLRGGAFRMGTNHGFPYEEPAHYVRISSFWMDKFLVTNQQFATFVAVTGYVTEAEKFGWSGVFIPAQHQWVSVAGAEWRHPEGPESTLTGRSKFPVLDVSWRDAGAYCEWTKKRLPTEAEWDFAARGGLDGATYSWGNELTPHGKHLANVWQGNFPTEDDGKDGFRYISPIGSFPPNGYGLYDMTGNVWEWTADWFSEDYYRFSNGTTNPAGPAYGSEKVIRGGSWLCSANYCTGYRVAARQKTAPDSGLNNLGFRCAR
jgi:sulfatase modifying factor 1